MLVRVGEIGKPAFRLRPGEKGLSIFDTEAVSPELSEAEIISEFRSGSVAIELDRVELTERELQIVPVIGIGNLPQRLRDAHAEIRPGDKMTRSDFKRQLRGLEDHVN